MNQEKFTLFQGDSREVIKQIPDNSIDSVVTDPPYGLNFMGKYWDTGEVAFDPKFWEEVLRVLKPGGHLLAFSGSRTYHRMACAIEDAGFEIRDQIMWLYGCLSEDSEILTKTGWKKGVELDGSELVAQWDHETNEISFVVPERVIIKPYVGKMVHLRNRHTDQLLTPDHRVYAKIRRHSRDPEPSCYEVVPAGELKDHWCVDIPMSGNLNNGEDVDPDYAYLVGWFLTDAWVHGDGKAVMFSQSKPHTLALLRNALSKYDHSEYMKKHDNPNHQVEHTFYVTGDIATKLINDWPERELDWRVLNWSAEARKRLLDGLIDGDGSRREHLHGHQFWSKNSRRLDIVSALYSMQGWRAYVNYKKGCVEANPKGKTQLQHKHRKNNPLVDYSGLVWCVTVPTGAFVARRNGKVFITGNSGFPKSLDVSKAIDKAAGAEREVVGKKFVTNAAQGKGFGHGELVGGKVRAGYIDITAPATEAARQWQGWGTALKPSFEPLCVAYKPLSIDGERSIIFEKLFILEMKLWSLLLANAVGENSTSSQNELSAACAIAQWSVVDAINTRDALCEAMGTSQFELATNTSLSIVSSWRRTLEEISKAGSTFTTETESSTTIDWKTLNFCLSQITPRSIITGLICQSGLTAFAEPAERYFYAELKRLQCTLELSALAPAISQDRLNSPDVDDKVKHEPIVMARKPFEGTVAENVLTHGTGALNIDASRIMPVDQERDAGGNTGNDNNSGLCKPSEARPVMGRWPANVIHDGSDEVLAGFPVVKSRGNRGESKSRGAKKEDVYSGGWVSNNSGEQYNHDPVGTIGSAARFFYCAKASKTERNDGLKSKTNNHPTVKPTKLMQYLCRLVTPPGGTILDPFTGSGSTGRGAILEGFRFVGIERDPEYIEIAESRIRAVSDNHSENNTDTVSLL